MSTDTRTVYDFQARQISGQGLKRYAPLDKPADLAQDVEAAVAA